MAKSVDILALLTGSPAGGDEDSSSDLRAKAIFKAIKNDDFASFKKALRDYVTKCKDDTPSTETDTDD